MDWINNYLNKPWVAYARGPHAYDCWGLVIAVLQNHFNRQPIDSHDEVTTDNREEITQAFYDEIRAGHWQQSPSAKHGSVVVCWVEQDGQLLVRHVGLYLSCDGGGVLHSRDFAGVRFDHLATLQRKFPKIEFYEQSSLDH